VRIYIGSSNINQAGGTALKLTPEEDAELKFLNRQVDAWFKDLMSENPPSNAKNNLQYAQEALHLFVLKRRKEGKDI